MRLTSNLTFDASLRWLPNPSRRREIKTATETATYTILYAPLITVYTRLDFRLTLRFYDRGCVSSAAVVGRRCSLVAPFKVRESFLTFPGLPLVRRQVRRLRLTSADKTKRVSDQSVQVERVKTIRHGRNNVRYNVQRPRVYLMLSPLLHLYGLWAINHNNTRHEFWNGKKIIYIY